jgi:alpha-tubulin suppressor-like RCC1 family protein
MIASASALLLGLLAAACNGELVGGGQRPAKLVVVSGDLQADTVGKELAQPLVVRVVDERDRPVRNQLVNFVVTAGGGSVFAGSAITNAQGEARERWTLGTVAGDTQRVEARAVDPATGQRIVFATFRAIGVPDAPAAASIVGSASRAGAAGGVVADSLAVRVVDKHGNAVPGVAVAFAPSNGGSVSPATAPTRADGTARAQWTLGGSTGAQTATATVAGFPALTFTSTVTTGAVTRVVLTPEAVGFNAIGQTQQMTVQAFDAFGNAVVASAMIISQNNAVAALDAGAIVRAAGVGSTRLIATVQGSTAADTTTVTVTQAVASIVVVPASATLADGETVQLQATARDAGGNPVPGVPFQYTASGPAISVTAGGLVTGRAGGVDSVRVSNGAVGTWVHFTVWERLRADQVSVGELHACAAGVNDRPYCWGRNGQGGIGNGSTGGPDTCSNGVPCHSVATGLNISVGTVSVGGASTCALVPDLPGFVFCWGDNGNGQLGDGTTTDRLFPTSLAPTPEASFRTVSQGGSHACGLKTNSEVWCWGAGAGVGNGSSAGSTVPVRVAGDLLFTDVSASTTHTCAIAGGRVYCWGENGSGQLGDGTFTTRTVPTLVPGVFSAMSVSAGTGNTCAVTHDGTAYCWGSNMFGALGTGSTEASVRLPAEVAGNLKFRMISVAQTRGCGVTRDEPGAPAYGNRAFCWGALEFTNSGNVTVTSSTPVEVPGSVAFVTLDTGPEATCGITVGEKHVRCWGRRSFGMLGDGVIPSTGTPGTSREPTFVRVR